MHPSDTQQLVFDPIVRQTILVSALYLSTALGGVLAFVYGARFGRLGLAVAVTSGVLIEAVASLTPVVSTAFPHSVELLADGVGFLVPHGSPDAIGAALRQVLTQPAYAAGMVANAARVAPALHWPAVADRYRDVAEALLRKAVA